ncbi:hypothetical protein CAEBREN_15514 [Caenorhabditis brenneri]|uniref:RING-type domain-containing protein n=1 Tax=Caenorhabditis brenneri TaxID=135651 RepID=G0PDI7_CAEBE|nr:hypothetical protein CAEBREN_15514 [Caenorhabditis brenneri]
MIITSSWSIAEYLTANESEFRLYEDPVVRIDEDDDEDSELSDSDSNVEDTMNPVTEHSVTTCKICLLGFSENLKKRAPLMLSCGHTFCWKCCKELKKQNSNMFVTCPFCRKETFGLLKELPKNYAIIEMIPTRTTENGKKLCE